MLSIFADVKQHVEDYILHFTTFPYNTYLQSVSEIILFYLFYGRPPVSRLDSDIPYYGHLVHPDTLYHIALEVV